MKKTKNKKKQKKYFLKKDGEEWVEINYSNQPTVIDALSKYIKDVKDVKDRDKKKDGIEIYITHTHSDGGMFIQIKMKIRIIILQTILTSIILSQKRKERIKVYLTNVGCGVFGK